jgi:ribosomal protein L3 glutamine methyltransferase
LTLQELIRQTEKRLRCARLHYGHGTDNPRDEAAFLVLRGLGLPFDTDLRASADPGKVQMLLHRRIEERTPAPYLLNEAWLSGLAFYVDRRVIIPRSHIAELLREPLPAWHGRPLARVLDLCTGSGCLAILAARAFPLALVDAADLSAAALVVARRNIARHRLERRVKAIKSDLFAALGHCRYDLILANPPYVTSTAMRRLTAEYRHEPGLALAAGKEGLDVVGRILAEARRYLAKTGWLVCEVGDRRKALERAFPRLPFLWPKEEVFMLQAASMGAALGSAARSRRASP